MDESAAERLVRIFDHLTGETHALFIFSQVLGKLHPHPDALLAELNNTEQAGLAHIEASALRDATVAAFQATILGLRQAILANPRYSPLIQRP
jgi:hypothetical protein